MSKKSIILAVGVVLVLIVLVGASRKMNKQAATTTPSNPNAGEVTTNSVSPLEQEASQINTGNVDADFKDIDSDIGNL